MHTGSGGCYVKMVAEIHKPMDTKDCQQTPRSQERGIERISPIPPRRNQPFRYLDLRLLAFRAAGQYVSVILATKLWHFVKVALTHSYLWKEYSFWKKLFATFKGHKETSFFQWLWIINLGGKLCLRITFGTVRKKSIWLTVWTNHLAGTQLSLALDSVPPRMDVDLRLVT